MKISETACLLGLWLSWLLCDGAEQNKTEAEDVHAQKTIKVEDNDAPQDYEEYDKERLDPTTRNSPRGWMDFSMEDYWKHQKICLVELVRGEMSKRGNPIVIFRVSRKFANARKGDVCRVPLWRIGRKDKTLAFDKDDPFLDNPLHLYRVPLWKSGITVKSRALVKAKPQLQTGRKGLLFDVIISGWGAEHAEAFVALLEDDPEKVQLIKDLAAIAEIRRSAMKDEKIREGVSAKSKTVEMYCLQALASHPRQPNPEKLAAKLRALRDIESRGIEVRVKASQLSDKIDPHNSKLESDYEWIQRMIKASKGKARALQLLTDRLTSYRTKKR